MKNKTIEILYNGKRISFNTQKWYQERRLKVHYCPICKREIKEGDIVFHILNENEFFPNCHIHKECLINESCNKTIQTIKKDFEDCRKKRFEIRHWFDYNYLVDEINRRNEFMACL